VLGREARQHEREVIEGGDGDGWWSRRHRRAGGLVAHPGGQLAKNADALLDQQKISRSARGALSDPQAPAIQRMPGVGDTREPQTVCGMMCGVEI
jgi:hypothetical protein